jgi:hypothetical protein
MKSKKNPVKLGSKYTDVHIQYIRRCLEEAGATWPVIAEAFQEEFPTFKGKASPQSLRIIYQNHKDKDPEEYRPKPPKILLFDIETLPIECYTWGIWQQNIGLNMIKQDWTVASFAAKWLGDPPNKVMYMDVRKEKNVRDDAKVLESIWKLMDEADILIGQNSKRFDVKKLNARFIQHGFQPPSSFKQIDTLEIAKKNFSFTSNKLEFTSDKLNKEYKKLKHNEFAGFELWLECLKGNPKAWEAMEEYNKYDVLSLEEYYLTLAPWDSSVNLQAYNEGYEHRCKCDSTSFVKSGFHFTGNSKFQKWKCTECGHEMRDKQNLLDKDKRLKIRQNLR